MVSWTTILLLGGTAVAVGAIAAYTKAGEGLRGVAGGLAEFVAAPIREGARAVGEIGLGVQQLGGGVGGAFAGIRSEFQAWIDMINKWQGIKPPSDIGGCVMSPEDQPCPTDKPYVRVDGQCCWGESARRCIPKGFFADCPPEYPEFDFWASTCCRSSTRDGARGLPPAPPPAPVLPIPPRPRSPAEEVCLASTCRDGSRPQFLWGTTCVCP